MTIVLHIGLPKTGSSAIQHALAEHRETLSARGLHYALEGASAPADKRLITSGNGALLARRLNPRRGSPEAAGLDFDSAFVSPDHPMSLISSEGLASADPEQLRAFRDEVIGGREVRIVAFVRDLYGHALSSWMQNIKRNGYAGRFEAFCSKRLGDRPHRALCDYEDIFGRGRLTVIHYDSLKRSVFHALLETLGVEGADLSAPPRVNRSLTPAETEVLIACNRINHGMRGLPARISDHLIYKHPDRAAPALRSERARAILADRFQAYLDEINDRFFPGRPMLAIGEIGPEEEARVEDKEAIWMDAVEALSQRLISLEAQSGAMQAQLDAVTELIRQRDELRQEVARLNGQSSLERLKLEIARTVRTGGRAGRPQD